MIAEIAVQGFVGATGKPPVSGAPQDKGELRAAMVIQDGLIRLEFGADLSYLMMTKQEALAFAAGLVHFADQLQGG